MNKIKRLIYCDQKHKHWYEYLYNQYYPYSPHNSKHVFDIYSLTHLFWSLFLTWFGLKIFPNNIYVPVFIFVFTTLFELYENQESSIIRYQRIEINANNDTSYRGDALINVIGDLIFNIIGIYIGYKLKDKTILIILGLTFIIITKIVGQVYWINFIKFLFHI